MDTHLRELLEAAVGEPPHRVRAEAVRRRVVRRRVLEAAAAAVAVAAVAVLIPVGIGALGHGPGPSTTGQGGSLTVRCTETLTGGNVTGGRVSGHGHCTLAGRLHDSGPATDYRTQTGEAIFIRRVITGAKGTITFVIKIPTAGAGGEPWTIKSGTGAYAKLHGRGDQVVDNYAAVPATFVLKGTVSPAQA